jgi:YD repeat-containing protein
MHAATPGLAAGYFVAKNNSITTASCSQTCSNPSTLISVDSIALTFTTRSNCTGRSFVHSISREPSPKQPPPEPDKNPVEGCGEGDPCSPTTGQNFQIERDFGAPTLRYVRRYNSRAFGRVREFTGAKWRSNYEKNINLIDDTDLSIGILTNPIAFVRRETGQEIQFELVNGAWVADPDITGILEQTPSGWTYRAEANLIETYDQNGRLVSQTDALGRETTLHYDGIGRLETVTGPFGRALLFAHDVLNRVRTMTDPKGNVYTYGYDSSQNLISVTYPDQTPADDTDNPVRRYHYEDLNFPNHLTGITDENGVRFASWTYDAEGRAVSSEQAGGVGRVDFVFNTDGTTTVTDARGAVRTYGLDTQFGVEKPVSVTGDQCTSCGNKASAASYDANGFLSSQTDFNGNVTEIVRDARGLELSRTEAVGTPEERTVTTQWHTDFRLPLLVTQAGKRTAFTYDSAGRLLSRTDTDTVTGRTRAVTNSYTQEGLLATVDGGRTDTSDITVFEYDLQGNLIASTNALGHQSIVTSYDANGRPLTIEDANGLLTTLAYDARGRLVSRDVGGQITLLDYDGVGNVTKTTLPDGSYLMSEYDGAQRLVALEDNLGNRTEFTLDAMGNRTAEAIRDDGGSVTRTRGRVFDLLNRLIQETGGAGQLTDIEYDLQGNVTALVDGNNKRSTNAYDGLNRLAKSIDPEFGETKFSYDARDNLLSVTDAEGLTTTYNYDGLENLISQVSPDTGTTRFTYDDAGNRISDTDARGVVANYAYDALNRLESIRFPDATKDIDLEYDVGPNGIGRLTRISDESGSTDFVYDLRGNILTEIRTIGGVSYSTAYTYDTADRIATITYPSGTIITYTRDALGRIDSVSATMDGDTRTLASNIRYLPFGPIQGYDFGNGIVLDRHHDLDYRLTDYTAGGVQDISIGYDAANNITSLTDALDGSRSQSFAYDSLNRLTHGEGVYPGCLPVRLGQSPPPSYIGCQCDYVCLRCGGEHHRQGAS